MRIAAHGQACTALQSFLCVSESTQTRSGILQTPAATNAEYNVDSDATGDSNKNVISKDVLEQLVSPVTVGQEVAVKLANAIDPDAVVGSATTAVSNTTVGSKVDDDLQADKVSNATVVSESAPTMGCKVAFDSPAAFNPVPRSLQYDRMSTRRPLSTQIILLTRSQQSESQP